jgi:malate dehydrogenase (oxaloacetate-decarboxylating)(NADP+)
MGFVDAIRDIKPHVLIGATGAHGTFTREVISAMADINRFPAIFALSNPTSRAECTAAEAYEWSGGRALFASGSPFGPVDYNGREYRPGQGNNVYIFPGMGLGALVSGATRISDDMFLIAARTLAGMVSQKELDRGTIYPPLPRIRDVSLQIATAVCEYVFENGLSNKPRPDDIEQAMREYMYEPGY